MMGKLFRGLQFTRGVAPWHFPCTMSLQANTAAACPCVRGHPYIILGARNLGTNTWYVFYQYLFWPHIT